MVFYFTDAQVADEAFLEDINNMLSSGFVPNLHAPEEVMSIAQDVELERAATRAGVDLAPDAMYRFFMERAAANIHVVLAMSPANKKFRDWLRMYPALVSSTTIDWFSEWPPVALHQVAEQVSCSLVCLLVCVCVRVCLCVSMCWNKPGGCRM